MSAKKMGRPKKDPREVHLTLLHQELSEILNVLVYSRAENQPFVKVWYNGDLNKLRLHCLKIANTIDSIHGTNIA